MSTSLKERPSGLTNFATADATIRGDERWMYCEACRVYWDYLALPRCPVCARDEAPYQVDERLREEWVHRWDDWDEIDHCSWEQPPSFDESGADTRGIVKANWLSDPRAELGLVLHHYPTEAPVFRWIGETPEFQAMRQSPVAVVPAAGPPPTPEYKLHLHRKYIIDDHVWVCETHGRVRWGKAVWHRPENLPNGPGWYYTCPRCGEELKRVRAHGLLDPGPARRKTDYHPRGRAAR